METKKYFTNKDDLAKAIQDNNAYQVSDGSGLLRWVDTLGNEYILQSLCGKCHKEKKPDNVDSTIGSTEWCNCGRPATYSKEILERAEGYLDLCQDEEVEEEKREGFVTYKIKAKLPTKGGLARHLGVSRETLYAWAKEYQEFSDIMETLGAEQEDRLINSGLSGDYNPTIAKVLLTKHGYVDKQDVTSDGKAIKGNGIVFSNFKDEE